MAGPPPPDEEFELRLPLDANRLAPATHVVELAGARDAFLTELATGLQRDRALASALRASVGTVSLGELADRLNALGHASVRSIDPLETLDPEPAPAVRLRPVRRR